MLDYLISGAEVYSGEGGPPQHVDVGIQNGRIAYMGEPLGAGAAHQRLDGRGKWLSPSFIDMHASTGLGYTRAHAADHKLYQGVGMELIGNCGTSTAPIGPGLVTTMQRLSRTIGFTFNWRDMKSYFYEVENFGLSINLATLVGHSTLRGGLVDDWTNVQEHELQAMAAALDEAMEQGAFGLSSGLIYPPGCFADTQELIRLAKVVARHGGFYASHIRDERDAVAAAVMEAMEIGRAGKIPVLISHLKAAEKPNWGKVPSLLASIEAFREVHQCRVAVDVYPYTAVSTKVRAFLPKELTADGVAGMAAKLAQPQWRERCHQWVNQRQVDFERMQLIGGDFDGETIAALAARRGQSTADTACDLVADNVDTWMVYHCMSQADVDAAVLWPDSMICSDSWSHPVNAAQQIGDPHPRTYGAFSRFLQRYVFDEGCLSYGDAIAKVTSKPADFLGLQGRGRLQVGCFADVLLLDPKTFADRATYAKPRQFSRGVHALWLNGRMAIREGGLTDEACGRIIRPRPR